MMSPEANRAMEMGKEEIAKIMQGRTVFELNSREMKLITRIKQNMENVIKKFS